MTQKEYQEKVNELETKIKDLEIRLEIEKNKNYKYEEVLENYHITNEELKRAIATNRDLNTQLLAKQEIIERYEVLFGRLNINC